MSPTDPTPEMLALSEMELIGSVTPDNWYKELKLDSGKTDTISVILLSEIVNWYLPPDPFLSDSFKKFESDLPQISYNDLSEKFGFTIKQIRESLKRLEDLGLVKRVFRTLQPDSIPIPNVMFLQIFPDKIIKITQG